MIKLSYKLSGKSIFGDVNFSFRVLLAFASHLLAPTAREQVKTND
jgi:hypothetical protein